MRGAIRSSRSRYLEYFRRRREARSAERVADRTSQRDKALASGAARGFFALFKAFWGLLKGRRLAVAFCLGTLTLSTAMGLVVPYFTKITIDNILTDSPGPMGLPAVVESFGLDRSAYQARDESRAPLLVTVGVLIFLLSVSAAVLGLWGRWVCTKLTKRIQVMLRRRAFQHAVRLPLTRISDLKSGGVASILREDAGNAGELLFSMIYNPWRAIIQLVGTIAILTIVDWRMLIGSLFLLPTVWLSHKAWIARIRPVYRDIRRTRQTIDAQAAESFGGIRVVRGFHRGMAEAGRFSRDNHFMARQELLAWWWSRLVELAWALLIPTASAAVLLYGGYRVLGEHLTVGDLMAFSAYVLMLLGPVEALVASAANIQSQLAGLDRTLDLLEEDREFEADGGDDGVDDEVVVTRALTRGTVTFEGVWFRYPRSRPLRITGHPDDDKRSAQQKDTGPTAFVLEDINLEIRAGQTVALVGASGSGKTTLSNLVARFYDPTEGRVLLDGVDMRTIDVDSYRRLLGIVEQDVFLFDGSVAENIAYARRDATMEQIVRAAEAANAAGFIDELEHGYETLIGERGVRLSGGQKQRIAIARAVLADPKILILDEATSSLDSESERLIQRSLDELMKNRTSVVIAHRLSTIRHADQIVVLERGRVIETGTHEELSAAGGRYAGLLELQLHGDRRGG